jgi:hypothetical protein
MKERVIRHSTVSCLLLLVAVAFLLPICAQAKPKKKIYNNSADQVFEAALRTARERHVVTYVSEKMLMFTFETGKSFTSEGFVANASVEPEGEDRATLIINVQHKKPGQLSFDAGGRMSDKFYEQVTQELAGMPKQKSAVKSAQGAVNVPEPKAVPKEPSMTRAPELVAGNKEDKGSIKLMSVPEGADVYVDNAFVGNAPATLKLSAGKHTVKVSQDGYKAWTKEISVYADSDVSLKAALEKN